jgi:hypothetical protein
MICDLEKPFCLCWTDKLVFVLICGCNSIGVILYFVEMVVRGLFSGMKLKTFVYSGQMKNLSGGTLPQLWYTKSTPVLLNCHCRFKWKQKRTQKIFFYKKKSSYSSCLHTFIPSALWRVGLLDVCCHLAIFSLKLSVKKYCQIELKTNQTWKEAETVI